MHAEESEPRKRSDGPVRTCRRACVSDTILTAVALVLATGGSYFIDWAEYTGGLRSLGVGRSFPLVLGMRPVIIVITLVVALRWLLAKSLVLSQRLLRFSFPASAWWQLSSPSRPPNLWQRSIYEGSSSGC